MPSVEMIGTLSRYPIDDAYHDGISDQCLHGIDPGLGKEKRICCELKVGNWIVSMKKGHHDPSRDNANVLCILISQLQLP